MSKRGFLSKLGTRSKLLGRTAKRSVGKSAGKWRNRFKRGMRRMLYNIAEDIPFLMFDHFLNNDPDEDSELGLGGVGSADAEAVSESLDAPEKEESSYKLMMPVDTSRLDDKKGDKKLYEELDKFNDELSSSADAALSLVNSSGNIKEELDITDYAIANNQLLKSLLKLYYEQNKHIMDYDSLSAKVEEYRLRNEHDRITEMQDKYREIINNADEINYGKTSQSTGNMIAESLANAKSGAMMKMLGPLASLLGMGVLGGGMAMMGGSGSPDPNADYTNESAGISGSMNITPIQPTSDAPCLRWKNQQAANGAGKRNHNPGNRTRTDRLFGSKSMPTEYVASTGMTWTHYDNWVDGYAGNTILAIDYLAGKAPHKKYIKGPRPTVRQIIYTWCPPDGAGNTPEGVEKYVRHVAEWTGLGTDTPVDLTYENLLKLEIAKGKQDSGYVNVEDAKKGVTMAWNHYLSQGGRPITGSGSASSTPSSAATGLATSVSNVVSAAPAAPSTSVRIPQEHGDMEDTTPSITTTNSRSRLIIGSNLPISTPSASTASNAKVSTTRISYDYAPFNKEESSTDDSTSNTRRTSKSTESEVVNTKNNKFNNRVMISNNSSPDNQR